MKILKLLCVFAAAVGLAGLAGCAHNASPLVGSWRLVPEAGERALTEEGNVRTTIKILNDNHFAFGIMTPDGEVFGGGGRYEYAEGTYTEIPEYHSLPYLVGRRIAFRCELKGDLWYHTGSFDAEGRKIEVREVWKRVEDKK